MRFISAVVVAMVAGLAGCGSTQSSADDQPQGATPPQSLEDARSLWEQNGSGNYAVTAHMSCYCPEELVQPIRLTVENGEVVSAEGLEQPLEKLPEDLARRLTVSGLFQFIEEAQDKETHKLDVTYDDQFGFPALIVYDGHPMIADDELMYRLSEFNGGAL